MIIVKLIGGMGNQMFQYAYARQLMEQYNDNECFLDLTWFNKNRKSHEKYMLNQFNINDNIKIINTKADLRKKVPIVNRILLIIHVFLYKIIFHVFNRKIAVNYGLYINKFLCNIGLYWYIFFYDFINLKINNKRNNYFIGYWQSYKFFENIHIDIKRELTPLVKNDYDNNLIKMILDKQSVALHIRRGDYLQNVNMNIFTDNYYNEAILKMNTLVDNPHYFVFSNDIDWVKQNMPFNTNNIIYVDQSKNDFEDFYYMKICKHYIMSNSTYCWWAQFLSDHDFKKVIAPKKWTENNMINDIYQSNWIII